jgi:hypothetical protein
MPELIPVFDDHSHLEINRLLNEALRCPECGASPSMLAVMSENITMPRFLIACRECKYEGPFGKSLYDAIKRWNKPIGYFAALRKNWAKK